MMMEWMLLEYSLAWLQSVFVSMLCFMLFRYYNLFLVNHIPKKDIYTTYKELNGPVQ